ncbi:alpha/beta hydrolase fold domain-containing protein [Catenuloplanes japonicus]|uniref:alpha/beta hydrolase fold domain-containing protein n=1 Tax=Catenuloplanes japonicus TaxID=33876 RepID=UPI00052469CF|nr:alpha/beta hydrolase fold domain-containing protein [Catenuloplanes japonicus]
MTLSLDPELAAVSAGGTSSEPLVPGDWKTWRDAVATVYPLLTAGLDRPDVAHRVRTATAADGTRIDLHWFAPADTIGTTAAVVHAHGGALVAGQVTHFAPFIARYVAEAGVPFLSVEYRLAPEASGSTPADDVFLGLTWLREHAGELGVDPARIAVMGESAGGTLAAATAIRARTEGIPLARQILVYPVLDNREVAPDPELLPFSADLYTLKITQWRSLLGDAWSGDAPATIVPARLDDHAGLAPAYVEVGELDALRDEAVAYAGRLWSAGVSAELHVLPGLTHGWDHIAPSIGIHAGVHARRVAVLRSL